MLAGRPMLLGHTGVARRTWL